MAKISIKSLSDEEAKKLIDDISDILDSKKSEEVSDTDKVIDDIADIITDEILKYYKKAVKEEDSEKENEESPEEDLLQDEEDTCKDCDGCNEIYNLDDICDVIFHLIRKSKTEDLHDDVYYVGYRDALYDIIEFL